jgi:plastocyanin
MNKDRIDRRSTTLLAGVLLLAAACGQSGGSRSPSGDVAKASPIDGMYFNEHSVLRIARGSFTLQAESLHLSGAISVGSHRLVLSKEASCTDRGTYSWVLRGHALTLQPVRESCAGRDVVMKGTWGPIAMLRRGTKVGAIVALPDLHFATYEGERDVSAATSATIDVSITEGTGYYFSPTVLVGSPGQKLRLTVSNPKKGAVPLTHNLLLPQQHIDVDIWPGATKTVTVTFPQSGSLTFMCKYHADHGQAGILSVD